MAVVAMWKCDRDDSMFKDKKEADKHDKMLELAESFASFLMQHAEGINDQDAENIGLLLSKNKEKVMTACKGKPEELLSISDEESEDSSNVTPLTANS